MMILVVMVILFLRDDEQRGDGRQLGDGMID